jgi:chorismate mutase/prephenate dehydrogenase
MTQMEVLTDELSQLDLGERKEELRREIDEIDQAIIDMWQRRNTCAAELGQIKNALGEPVYQHGRDIQVRKGFIDGCEAVGVRRELGKAVISAIMQASYHAQGRS